MKNHKLEIIRFIADGISKRTLLSYYECDRDCHLYQEAINSLEKSGIIVPDENEWGDYHLSPLGQFIGVSYLNLLTVLGEA